MKLNVHEVFFLLSSISTYISESVLHVCLHVYIFQKVFVYMFVYIEETSWNPIVLTQCSTKKVQGFPVYLYVTFLKKKKEKK